MARAFATMFVFATVASSAYALDPRYAVSQYVHTAWTEQGGAIRAGSLQIAQTTDGFIWLAGEAGVVRFDGVRFVPWAPPGGRALGNVQRLLASPDGSLWFGTMAFAGTHDDDLFRWRDGEWIDYGARNRELAGRVIAMLSARSGTTWVGYQSGKLCQIAPNDAVSCRVLPHSDPRTGGDRPFALYEDHAGAVWIGGERLYRSSGDGFTEIELPRNSRFPMITAMVEDGQGRFLLLTSHGLRRLNHGRVESFSLPGLDPSVFAYDVLRDRDGAIWIATTNRGLVHIGRNGVDAFSKSDGLPSDVAERFLEDREGNVWVTTEGGVSQFRGTAVVTLTTREGLTTTDVQSLVARSQDEVWISAMRQAMMVVRPGQVALLKIGTDIPAGGPGQLAVDARGRVWTVGNSLFYVNGGRSVPVTIREASPKALSAIAARGSDEVWLQIDSATVAQVRVDDRNVGHIVSRHGFPGQNLNALAVDRAGGVWASFAAGGVARWFNDRWIEFGERDGLTFGPIRSLSPDVGGAMWLAGANGLGRIEDGRIATMTRSNGLPCGVLRDMVRDINATLWVVSQCGLLSIDKREVQAWWSAPARTVRFRTFDSLDGFSARTSYPPVNQRSAATPDGRLWFVLDGPGIGILDPDRVPLNRIAPPVTVEDVVGDGTTFNPSTSLPALTRNIQIDYTALSYTIPERIHFRYRLDGFDTEWHEVKNVRQATYTNLSPRSYRFQVMAANNDGVWNTTPATLSFSIRPAFYQTRWFAFACVLGAIGCAWCAYRGRLRYRLRHMNRLFEERLDERTRIAQELHDTLIQDLTAVSLSAELIDDQLPSEPIPAKETLAGLRREVARIMANGRAAMATLRFVTVSNERLVDALSRAVSEVRGGDDPQPRVEFIVEGTEYPLRYDLRDELYRIGREALSNAMRHSSAHHVVVELLYEPTGIRLRVADDGQGMDEAVIANGRPGHFGLRGMHERARRLNAKFDVVSRRGAGTEVSITVSTEASAVEGAGV